MPRPRFTLRMVLALTAVAAYVAWQVGMVQQRKAAMKGTHVFVLDRSGAGINPIRALFGDAAIEADARKRLAAITLADLKAKAA